MEWQPIETAPKDRTQIILFDGDKVTTGRFDGCWWEECEVYEGEIAMWPKPRCWMPLPAPPAQGIETRSAEIAQQAPSEG